MTTTTIAYTLAGLIGAGPIVQKSAPRRHEITDPRIQD